MLTLISALLTDPDHNNLHYLGVYMNSVVKDVVSRWQLKQKNSLFNLTIELFIIAIYKDLYKHQVKPQYCDCIMLPLFSFLL